MAKATLEERFWAKVDKGDGTGCWLWTGAKDTWGYGQFSLDGRWIGAHRAAYQLVVGPIPKGLELDHLCRNRLCIRPDHLEPVTRRENQRRGDTFAARHAAQTHCKHGHPFDLANTHIDGLGRRVCRTCRRLRERRYREARQ